MEQFEEQNSVIQFANVTEDFATGTLKLALSVQNWPFQSLSNSLFITMAEMYLYFYLYYIFYSF
jgi:hypothetical protein